MKLIKLHADYAEYRSDTGEQIHIGKAAENEEEHTCAIMFGALNIHCLANIYVLKDGWWYQKGQLRDVPLDQSNVTGRSSLDAIYQRWLADIIVATP